MYGKWNNKKVVFECHVSSSNRRGGWLGPCPDKRQPQQHHASPPAATTAACHCCTPVQTKCCCLCFNMRWQYCNNVARRSKNHNNNSNISSGIRGSRGVGKTKWQTKSMMNICRACCERHVNNCASQMGSRQQLSQDYRGRWLKALKHACKQLPKGGEGRGGDCKKTSSKPTSRCNKRPITMQ